jgi:5S rRNA maturation endonuclease (ribonuclease M5)
MNIIDPDFIRTYCLEKFKDNYRLSSSGEELVIPSIFMGDDYNRHMSINLETGLWRCFKSGNAGNFVKLYSIVENIPYKAAYNKFIYDSFLLELNPKPKVEEVPKTDIEDTSSFIPASECDEAVKFIESRKLSKFNFLVALDGFYSGRLIIPYLKENGSMFYFQARALEANKNPKYLNCKDFKSSHILYPFDYDSGSDLYVTEGAFDCLALKMCGFNATTTISCNVSKEQMQQLKLYQGDIILAYDSDKAGRKGAAKFLRTALEHKVDLRKLKWCSPITCKDWNETYVSKGMEGVIDDIKTSLDYLSEISLAVSSL